MELHKLKHKYIEQTVIFELGFITKNTPEIKASM